VEVWRFLCVVFSDNAGEFKKAYPEAKLIGVEPLIEKKKSEELVFDGGQSDHEGRHFRY
jgi:hypothetical protein